MVLAIEPMINAGTHKFVTMPDGWLVCTKDGKPSAHFEKTVAITEDGPVVLTTEPISSGQSRLRVNSYFSCLPFVSQ